MRRRSFLGLIAGAVAAPAVKAETVQEIIDRGAIRQPEKHSTTPKSFFLEDGSIVTLGSRGTGAGYDKTVGDMMSDKQIVRIKVGDNVTFSGDHRTFKIIASGEAGIG